MANFPNLSINDTGNLTMPVGTTSERPGSANNGYTRFNSDDNILETRIPSAWQECRRELKEAGRFLYASTNGTSNGGIIQFTTDQPYNFTSNNVTWIPGIDVNAGGGTISHDGKLFFATSGLDNIRIYECSTPFDLTTVSFVRTDFLPESSGLGNSLNWFRYGRFCWAGPTGSNANYSLFEMSQPYDVRTASFVKNHTLSNVSGHAGTIAFTPTGDRCFIGERSGASSHHQYDLTTPFDISTETNRQDQSVSNTDAVGMCFSPSGYVYYTGHHSPDGVFKYVLDTAFDITTRIDETFIRDFDDIAGGRTPINGCFMAGVAHY